MHNRWGGSEGISQGSMPYRGARLKKASNSGAMPRKVGFWWKFISDSNKLVTVVLVSHWSSNIQGDSIFFSEENYTYFSSKAEVLSQEEMSYHMHRAEVVLAFGVACKWASSFLVVF